MRDGMMVSSPYSAMKRAVSTPSRRKIMVGFCTRPLSPMKDGRPADGNDVRVAARIDDDLGAGLDEALLGPDAEPLDELAALDQGSRRGRVIDDRHAGLRQEAVGCLAPDQRVMHPVSMSCRRGRPAQARPYPRAGGELLGKSEYHLLRPGRAVVRRLVEAAHRARHSGDRAAAAEAVALDQRDAQALARRRHRRRNAGRAAADHQHVAGQHLIGSAGPTHRHRDLHLARVPPSLSYGL